MAGAFTHFIICDIAKRRRSVISTELWRLLNKYSQFLYIGAASPDLPYLSFKTGTVNWADIMHYEKTNSTVISGYADLKRAWPFKNPSDEIKFIWLLGYVSHLIADATIHPIVQAIVGPYEQNKEDHRICEMTQDSLVFNEYKKSDIYYSEFSSILKFCNESVNFNELMEFWKMQVMQNYKEKNEEPHPKLWFKTYTEAIDSAEGGSDVVALFRHIGIAEDYIYRTKDVITSEYSQYYEKYYTEVKLPTGNTGLFKKEGFECTVNNVTTAWGQLYKGLGSDISVADLIRNWNLDTGVDMNMPNGEVTYWIA